MLLMALIVKTSLILTLGIVAACALAPAVGGGAALESWRPRSSALLRLR
jgi:hypothetical protein